MKHKKKSTSSSSRGVNRLSQSGLQGWVVYMTPEESIQAELDEHQQDQIDKILKQGNYVLGFVRFRTEKEAVAHVKQVLIC